MSNLNEKKVYNKKKEVIVTNILNIFFVITIINFFYLKLYIISFISLIMGIVFKIKGYNCKKNIIASVLVTIYSIIAIIILPAFDMEANNYQQIIEYGKIINFKFPATGDCYIENLNYENYYNDNKYISKLGFIKYNENEAKEILESIKKSDIWLNSISDELSIYDTNYGMKQYDYFLIYNNTTKKYNEPLNNSKTINEIYYLAYDVEKRECTVAIYDIEG